MYLGRQVMRRSASTLRPVAGSRVRARTSTPWQIATAWARCGSLATALPERRSDEAVRTGWPVPERLLISGRMTGWSRGSVRAWGSGV